MKPVLIILAVLVVLIGGGTVAWQFFQRAVHPFEGETEHDFGTVLVSADGGTVKHVFQLRNRSDTTLHIDHLHRDCGCVSATADVEVIEPGASVRIAVELEIKASSIKEVQIDIHTAEFGMQPLMLTARGRRDPPFFVTVQEVEFNEDGTDYVILNYWTYEASVTPGAIEVQVPEGVSTIVGAWEANRAGKPAKNWPTRWKARVDLSRDDGLSEVGGELLATVGEYELSIPFADAAAADDAAEPAPSEDGSPIR